MHTEEEKTTTGWLKEAQKGYIRIAILILLNKKQYHGYEIMKEIKDRTRGFWRPTPGGVYPILRSLEKAGYIKGEWLFQEKRRRKIYRITDPGRLILEAALAKQTQIANSMSTLFNEFSRDVLDIETKVMPRVPNPFSIFLEDRNKEPEDRLEALEMERKHIEHLSKMLQSKLRKINQKLAQLKEPERKDAMHA